MDESLVVLWARHSALAIVALCLLAVTARAEETPHSLDVLWEKHRALEQLVAERRESDQRALEHQAKEYERRLEHLNGEQARMVTRNADYIGREVFDNKVNALETRQDAQGKLIYIGLGMVLVAQFAFGYLRRKHDKENA